MSGRSLSVMLVSICITTFEVSHAEQWPGETGTKLTVEKTAEAKITPVLEKKTDESKVPTATSTPTPVPTPPAQTSQSKKKIESLEARLKVLEALIPKTTGEEADRVPASLRRDSLTEREETKSSDLVISAIIEVGYSAFSDYSKVSGSDITNDTVQIDIEKKLSDITAARITLVHKDGGDPDNKAFDVDEAFFILGKETGLFLKAGKIFVGSGNFNSEFISNPFTQDLAETNENAVAVGFRTETTELNVYTFNGDSNKMDSANKVRSFGAHLESTHKLSETELKGTVSYLNNIAEADALGTTDVFTDKNADTEVNDLNKLTQSVVVGLDAENEYFVAHAEWFSTLAGFDKSDLDWNGEDARVTALKLEAGVKTKLFEKDSLFMVGYQTSKEALKIGLPELRWLAGLKVNIQENVELSYEFKYDEDYGLSETSGGFTGTGGYAHTHSVLVGLSF